MLRLSGRQDPGSQSPHVLVSIRRKVRKGEFTVSLPLVLISWAIITFTCMIAIRLGRVAVKNHSTPEALLALFFGGGALGYALQLLDHSFELSSGAIRLTHDLSGTVLILPAVTVVLFTWQVFRRDSTWAKITAWSMATFTVVAMILSRWLAAPLGLEAQLSGEPGSAFYWISTGVRASGFAWSCVEASIFYSRARLRLAAGLIDALVANRFLLWAVWSGAATTMVSLRIVSAALVGPNPRPGAVPTPIVVMMLATGLVCVGAMWLTFSAPAFYRRLVEGGAAREA